MGFFLGGAVKEVKVIRGFGGGVMGRVISQQNRPNIFSSHTHYLNPPNPLIHPDDVR